MAWHIFKKDLILLWPLVALSAFAQLSLNALMYVADRTPDSQYFVFTARLSVFVVFIAIALVISLGVHQEPIPGTRQDWLIRPIHRLDLFLAKFLFVLAAVQLPMFMGDVIEAMAQGFSWQSATMAALSRNLYVLVTISLPAFGFAAMSRNTAQFIGIGLIYVLAVTAATFFLSNIARISGEEQATNPLYWTGIAWIPQTVARAGLLAGAIVVLLLLYFGRKVGLARSVFPLFAGLSVLATFLPWGLMFAVQESASATPIRGQNVEMRFYPQAARYRPLPGENSDAYSAGAAQVLLRGRAAGDIEVENRVRHTQGYMTIFIPIQVNGLPAGALPWADRAIVTLRTLAGKIVFQGRGDDLKLDHTQSRPQAVAAYEAVRIPALVYEAAKEESLTLDIDYSLSVLRPQLPVAAAALGADAQLAGFGQCSSDRDSDGNDIELRCLQSGKPPSCVAVTLEDASNGLRNPESFICSPDYSPYISRPFPDSISRFQVEAPFRDRLGLVSYPVGGPQLASARLILTRYDATQHLTRRVTAEQIRLAAWLPGSSRH